jgi:hypothetical protein
MASPLLAGMLIYGYHWNKKRQVAGLRQRIVTVALILAIIAACLMTLQLALVLLFWLGGGFPRQN